MTHAELLRSHADAALREGGMYYSGEYLSRMASVAESLEAENAKLRKVCKRMHDLIKNSCDVCDEYYCSSWDEDNECCVFDSYMRELGVDE